MQMRRTTQCQRAIEAIKQGLIERNWEPGDRISLETIANELDTSLTPVRDAVNELISQGLIERVNGVGTCVAQPMLEQLSDVVELRALLEERAAQWVQERANDMVMATLMSEARELDEWTNAKFDELPDAADAPSIDSHRADIEKMEIQFHHHFVEAARSPDLLRAWEPCYLLSLLARINAGIVRSQMLPEEKYEGHQRLMTIVAQGDAVAAGHAAREHVLDPQERLVNQLYTQHGDQVSSTAPVPEVDR